VAAYLFNRSDLVKDDFDLSKGNSVLEKELLRDELKTGTREGDRTHARDRRDARYQDGSARGLNIGLVALPAFMAFCAIAVAQTSPAGNKKGDRDLGQFLSSECVTCHQASGQQAGGVPAITGWADDQFVAVMRAYKNRERDNQVMQAIAARLSDEEIAALAAYFGELKPKN
jgi:cytochrome c553